MSTLTGKKSTSLTEKPQFRIGSVLAYITLGVTTFLVVFPFWWMLVVASNEKNEIAKNPPRFTLGDQLPVTFVYKKIETTVKTTVVHNSSYYFKRLLTSYSVCYSINYREL